MRYSARPRPGGGLVAAEAFTSTPVDISTARGFYIFSKDDDALICLRDNDTVIASMDAAGVATTIAMGQLYGPLDVMTGFDKYLHVAGAAVATDIVITTF